MGEISPGGAVKASYAGVAVAMNSPGGRAGGLVGYSSGGAISASYAAGAVTVTDSSNARVGGLVGQIADDTTPNPDVPATIDASYARGVVSGRGAGAGRVLAGLVAASSSPARVTNSYYDNTAAGTTLAASAGGGSGQSAAALQRPTDYGTTGIYANWNVDVDGDRAADDPWHFGSARQYPILKYYAGVDYDRDDDGLIEISSLAQLDAVRYDLDGDGRPTTMPGYLAAFPMPLAQGANIRMGCDYDHDNDQATAPRCRGYELTANLDFDENGDGQITAADATYWNGGAGWNPIGGHGYLTHQAFTAIFEGNGHTISNLYINLDTNARYAAAFVGLFASIGRPFPLPAADGIVRNVGLVNPFVSNTRSGNALFVDTGALAGRINTGNSIVSGSYVAGGSVTATANGRGLTIDDNLVGCLLGYSGGTVSGSYAGCAVTATGDNRRRDRAGGLVGRNDGTVRDSYATGNVRGDNEAGGLVGFMGPGGQITGSYATGAVSVSDASDRANEVDSAKGGGLVGDSRSNITDSYATGNVTAAAGAQDAYIGGLVGSMDADGAITAGSHATGTVTGASGTTRAKLGGLVGEVSGRSQVISSYAGGAVTANGAASQAGGLVGLLTGSGSRIGASYATGAVTANAPGVDPLAEVAIRFSGNRLGGLVGRGVASVAITASYAAGAVSATAGGNNVLGGLVGIFDAGSPILTASYATGALSVGAAGNNTRGGLVGGAIGITGNFVTNSYWDDTVNPGLGSAAGGSGQATTALQRPTEYGATGIYANWNVDVDNADDDGDLTTNTDDPWHFGTDAQYPILKFGHDAASIARQVNPQYAPADYDSDNDNLIDITTLAQLDAIRYDLNGDGRNAGDAAIGYAAAFPGATPGMGCPAACAGYELRADLDFDYDGNGSSHSNGAIDAGDAVPATAAYFDSTAGWTPLGGHSSTAAPFTAIFEGNHHTIANLYINLATNAAGVGNYAGLFADLGAAGAVRNLGLVDPYVKNRRDDSGNGESARTGALAGRLDGDATGQGTVSGVYVSGGSVTGEQNTTAATPVDNLAGCLLGDNNGIVSASYATCAARAVGTDDATDQAGGLIGRNAGAVNASYATGTVQAHTVAGGLVGVGSGSGGIVTASYATGAVSGSGGADKLLGGLVGQLALSANVNASYATGAVSASGGGVNSLGGLVGSAITGGTVTNSHWDRQTTGQATSAGGAGATAKRHIRAANPHRLRRCDVRHFLQLECGCGRCVRERRPVALRHGRPGADPEIRPRRLEHRAANRSPAHDGGL